MGPWQSRSAPVSVAEDRHKRWEEGLSAGGEPAERLVLWLDGMEQLGLIREVIGQGRYRMWRL